MQSPRSPYQPPEPFRCDVRADGDRVWLSAVGELDLDTVEHLRRALAAARGRGYRRVVLDLRGLEFIDSTGLRLMIECDAEARTDGFEFAIVPGSEAVRRLFRVTGMEGHFAEADPPRDA